MRVINNNDELGGCTHIDRRSVCAIHAQKHAVVAHAGFRKRRRLPAFMKLKQRNTRGRAKTRHMLRAESTHARARGTPLHLWLIHQRNPWGRGQLCTRPCTSAWLNGPPKSMPQAWSRCLRCASVWGGVEGRRSSINHINGAIDPSGPIARQ